MANAFSAGPMGRLLERRERVLRRREREAVFEVPVGHPQVRAQHVFVVWVGGDERHGHAGGARGDDDARAQIRALQTDGSDDTHREAVRQCESDEADTLHGQSADRLSLTAQRGDGQPGTTCPVPGRRW